MRGKNTTSVKLGYILYTGYLYRVDVQEYEVIEVDMYMGREKVTRQQDG
jgi:hypothetical protein